MPLHPINGLQKNTPPSTLGVASHHSLCTSDVRCSAARCSMGSTARSQRSPTGSPRPSEGLETQHTGQPHMWVHGTPQYQKVGVVMRLGENNNKKPTITHSTYASEPLAVEEVLILLETNGTAQHNFLTVNLQTPCKRLDDGDERRTWHGDNVGALTCNLPSELSNTISTYAVMTLWPAPSCKRRRRAACVRFAWVSLSTNWRAVEPGVSGIGKHVQHRHSERTIKHSRLARSVSAHCIAYKTGEGCMHAQTYLADKATRTDDIVTFVQVENHLFVTERLVS